MHFRTHLTPVFDLRIVEIHSLDASYALEPLPDHSVQAKMVRTRNQRKQSRFAAGPSRPTPQLEFVVLSDDEGEEFVCSDQESSFQPGDQVGDNVGTDYVKVEKGEEDLAARLRDLNAAKYVLDEGICENVKYLKESLGKIDVFNDENDLKARLLPILINRLDHAVEINEKAIHLFESTALMLNVHREMLEEQNKGVVDMLKIIRDVYPELKAK